MHTFEEIQEVVAAISYKPGWSFRVEQIDQNGHFFVQVCVDESADVARDAQTGEVAAWRGGKWLISQHMTRNEIVRTVHKAVIGAEMHELDEYFRYRGRAIYNPHLDPDQMAKFAGKLDNFEFRADSMMLMEDEAKAA
jgi:hypothetical protein